MDTIIIMLGFLAGYAFGQHSAKAKWGNWENAFYAGLCGAAASVGIQILKRLLGIH